jgi:hypothetical protein
VLTGHKLKVAREMYASGQYTAAAIATTLGVSRASIYRHLGVSSRQAESNTCSEGDGGSLLVLRRHRWTVRQGGGPVHGAQGPVKVEVCTKCLSMPKAGLCPPTWINAAM